MYLAYKYVRDKRRAAKATHDAEHNGLSAATGPPRPETQPKGKAIALSKSTQWKLILMAALLVPVLLRRSTTQVVSSFPLADLSDIPSHSTAVVATAQVHISSVFNRLDLQSYIGTIYLLTSTVFLPLFASLADVWGRHWALQFALFCFLLGSAISTMTRIIMSDSNSLDDNNWQQSMLFFLYTIGYCVGPVIGGALTSVNFRWIFAINLPAALAAMVLTFFIVRGRTKGPQPAHNQALPFDGSTAMDAPHETFTQKLLRIDWVGAVLFMIAGITLLLALNWGSTTTSSWSEPRVIACFAVAGVAYIAWIAWENALERRQARDGTSRNPLMRTDPMIPLELFKSKDLVIAQLGVFVSGMVMIVMFYFIAIFFTIVSGLTGTEAGQQLLYFAPGLGAGALISIQFMKFLRQPKIPIVLGSIIITTSLPLIAWAMGLNDQKKVQGFLVLAGAGVGMSIGPLAIHCRFSQPTSRVAVVSALTLFSRSLGGTVGLAQCGAVLNAKVSQTLAARVAAGELPAAVGAALADGVSGLSAAGGGLDALPPAAVALVQAAFQEGSKWAFYSLIPWAGVALVLSVFLSDIKDTDAEAKAGTAASDEKEVKPLGKTDSSV
ncbi:MFS general substrate transporter [Epithele typhae]|uniref:MFS general substrate transporter n=1 Tax=Epithele typhae TaxID=378194 RepID=UPI00200822DE|nr:MFS general substrate transporter [Epithele typhae]KAH9946096.1 MFS general substrate transporter [Epithele typhae]